MSILEQWGSFYTIVGAAAGALIGLQFIVVVLVAERPTLRGSMAGAAFATPTIVHFSAALLVSALLRVPWQTITLVTVLLGLMGFSGIVYMMIVNRHIREQSVYQPAFEDWLFHTILPLATYFVIVLSALVTPFETRKALFGVGGATLLLLFIGIHNAWDSIAYHVFGDKRNTDKREDRGEPPQ
jgi:hypothetical protein